MSFVAVSVGTAALGAGQAVSGAITQGKALRQLERLKTPTVAPSKSINDYYQEALNRYNVNPYTSRLYQVQQQQVVRNLATSLNASSDRRGGLATVGGSEQAANDAMLKAGTAAEQQQSQRFGQLGGASGMKDKNDQYVFGINQMLPYQKQAQLLSQKASAGGQMLNAGLQNISGAAQNYGEFESSKNMYGSQGLRRTPTQTPTHSNQFKTGYSVSPNSDAEGNYYDEDGNPIK